MSVLARSSLASVKTPCTKKTIRSTRMNTVSLQRVTHSLSMTLGVMEYAVDGAKDHMISNMMESKSRMAVELLVRVKVSCLVDNAQHLSHPQLRARVPRLAQLHLSHLHQIHQQNQHLNHQSLHH